MATQEIGATMDADAWGGDEVKTQQKAWGMAFSTNPAHANHKLFDDEITVGRNSTCHIHHPQMFVSGIHCKIVRQGDVLWLYDLSSNGTFWSTESSPRVKIGKGNRRLISPGTKVTVVPKGPKREEISYIIYTYEQKKGPDAELATKYDMRQVLGTGAFATVKLCINILTGDKYACKIIDKRKFQLTQGSSSRADALMDEVKILQRLDHHGIIKIYDVIDTPDNLYLILELVTGGDLFDQIIDTGAYEESRARGLFKQMVETIQYLHEENIAHRDLKPENILLKEKGKDDIKISDFGLSRIIGEGSFMKTLCGTPQYLAPEVITNSSKTGYGKAVDLWSLGVILYILLSGAPPFDDDDGTPILDQVKSGVIDFPPAQWDTVSPSARDLVERLLVVDPAKRLSTKDTLEHPWMQGKSDLPSKKRKGSAQDVVDADDAGNKKIKT